MNESWIIIALIIFLILWFSFKETRSQHKLEDHIESTRRTEIINGKKYSVVSVPRILLREKRSKRNAVVILSGAEKDPLYKDGKLIMYFPRWVKVQYLLKNGSYSKTASGWRASNKFEYLQNITVDEHEEIDGE